LGKQVEGGGEALGITSKARTSDRRKADYGTECNLPRGLPHFRSKTMGGKRWRGVRLAAKRFSPK